MLPIKDDWATGERQQMVAEKQRIKDGVRRLMDGEEPKWGDRAWEAPAIPMLQPIDRVPRNGKTIMVYCPGETPEHVAAVWSSASNEDGTIVWEGLMFAEPMLADVCPDGPQNATHWYYPPTLDTRIRPHDGGRIDADALRKEYETSFAPTAPHHQFTAAQRNALLDRGIRPEDAKVYWLTEIENESIATVTSTSIYNDREVIRTERKRPCPILTDFRPKRNQAYIVWPHGDIAIVELGDQKP